MLGEIIQSDTKRTHVSFPLECLLMIHRTFLSEVDIRINIHEKTHQAKTLDL